MNKELIKKYKTEFDHWLNGGKLLSKYTLIPTWSDCQSEDIWRIPDENISKVLIVINDEYVIYRKALAEGKIVEVATDYNDVDGYIWKSMEDEEFHHFNIEEIRIKPEEPKFKVGDWVIHNGEYKQVTKAIDGYIDSLDNKVAVIMKEESLELWKPKEKEYFWYRSDLVKFHKSQTDLGTLLESARGCSYYPLANFEDYCEPFIGQLPSFLKDSDES